MQIRFTGKRGESVWRRPRCRIERQREPGPLAANAFGAEHDIVGVFLEGLQNQGAELARRRPCLIFAESHPVIGYDDRNATAFLLTDQFQLPAAAADER